TRPQLQPSSVVKQKCGGKVGGVRGLWRGVICLDDGRGLQRHEDTDRLVLMPIYRTKPNYIRLVRGKDDPRSRARTDECARTPLWRLDHDNRPPLPPRRPFYGRVQPLRMATRVGGAFAGNRRTR